MRVTTAMIFDRGVSALQRQQQTLLEVQAQLATGRRVVTPSDDPIASARALELSQSAARNTQFGENRGFARDSLALTESTLAQVGRLITDVRTAAVAAGNGTLSDGDRNAIAVELKERFGELLGLANTTDGTGQFLFSGYRGATQPFLRGAAGVQYAGDQGQRLAQVEASIAMPVSESGDAIFQRIPAGNGVFRTEADGANAGSTVIDGGSVVNPAQITGHRYEIAFSVAGGVTTYSVADLTAGTTLSSGNPYTSGTAIAFDGLQFTARGVPADGDRVRVEPAGTQSLFVTLQDLIAAIEAPTPDAAAQARRENGLNAGLANLDQALDHVLAVRASAGARLAELDALDAFGEDLALQFQQTVSRLVDVDIAQAISDVLRQQQSLEASQQSFARVAGLSLFNFL